MKKNNARKWGIVCITDPYHGSHKAGFTRFNENNYCKVLDTNLTLSAAKAILLKYFREEKQEYIANWGVAVRRFPDAIVNVKNQVVMGYDEDVYRYRIVEIEDQEL